MITAQLLSAELFTFKRSVRAVHLLRISCHRNIPAGSLSVSLQPSVRKKKSVQKNQWTSEKRVEDGDYSFAFSFAQERPLIVIASTAPISVTEQLFPARNNIRAFSMDLLFVLVMLPAQMLAMCESNDSIVFTQNELTHRVRFHIKIS